MVTDDQKRAWLNRLLHLKAGGDKQRLAELLGMNRTQISLMLGGKQPRPISEKNVYRIANKLHVEPPHGMEVMSEAAPRKEVTKSNALGEDVTAAITRVEQSLAALSTAQLLILAELRELRKAAKV